MPNGLFKPPGTKKHVYILLNINRWKIASVLWPNIDYKFQTTSCGRGYRSKGYAWQFANAILILIVGYPHNWRKEKGTV